MCVCVRPCSTRVCTHTYTHSLSLSISRAHTIRQTLAHAQESTRLSAIWPSVCCAHVYRGTLGRSLAEIGRPAPHKKPTRNGRAICGEKLSSSGWARDMRGHRTTISRMPDSEQTWCVRPGSTTTPQSACVLTRNLIYSPLKPCKSRTNARAWDREFMGKVFCVWVACKESGERRARV